uniref:Uncharacterized protein n=1 Tax=Hordeum vulgare subsp. vulgare TaxID=112509 RepID=A0A8I6Z5Y2_HORVV
MGFGAQRAGPKLRLGWAHKVRMPRSPAHRPLVVFPAASASRRRRRHEGDARAPLLLLLPLAAPRATLRMAVSCFPRTPGEPRWPSARRREQAKRRLPPRQAAKPTPHPLPLHFSTDCRQKAALFSAGRSNRGTVIVHIFLLGRWRWATTWMDQPRAGPSQSSERTRGGGGGGRRATAVR